MTVVVHRLLVGGVWEKLFLTSQLCLQKSFESGGSNLMFQSQFCNNSLVTLGASRSLLGRSQFSCVYLMNFLKSFPPLAGSGISFSASVVGLIQNNFLGIQIPLSAANALRFRAINVSLLSCLIYCRPSPFLCFSTADFWCLN